METKLKERLNENSLHGLIKNIKTIRQRLTKISTSAAAVAGSSYEASKACEVHKVEVDCQRAKALAEARRQTLTGR